VELQRRIVEGAGEFLLFALTPPRLTTEPEQAGQIAARTLERLRPVGIDGLVLYDIDDESDRNPEERPFPFLPTMDPADYLARDLVGLEVPAIVYRAVSKYPEQALRAWLSEAPSQALSVFVGASSREKAVATSLSRAYELRSEVRPDLVLGGVAIPERHTRGRGEHVRLLAKQAAGCSFFVTQIVYDVNAAKSLVSDYHYECAARDLEPAPIVFTFSVCGSLKTLEFVQWLGVDVPHWIENELRQRGGHPRRVLRPGPRHRPRADRILPAPGGAIRAQRRERLDPPSRDRGLHPPRDPPTSRATPLVPTTWS
jgi:hypothetical protein